jgi:dTDP-4-amino-4,6-dideoxygalactose transaminase
MMEFNDLRRQRERLGGRINEAIAAVLEHGRFILGPEVGELEERLSAFTSSRAVTCANGTDAIVLALMAIGVGPGHGVVVPSFTFSATAEAVALVGAVPVFADIDRRTGLLTPETTRSAIEAGRRANVDIRAVITVDLFGQIVTPRPFIDLAAEEGLFLISDAAQSFGATFDGARVGGALVPITTTSFFPSKPLGCYGDGGALLVEDETIERILRSLRVHGQGSNKYDNVRVGMNSRLDTLQAAVLLAKLELLEAELIARRSVAASYRTALMGIADVLHVDPRCESAWAQLTVTIDHRADVATKIGEAGIPSAVYYPVPLHRQPAYADSPVSDDMSGSEWLAAHVLSLPMHPYLTDEEVGAVAAAVSIAVEETRRA